MIICCTYYKLLINFWCITYFSITHLGGKIAKDLNIPEDLVNKGSFDQWDVLECIKNLKIMSRVYDE